MRSKSDSEPNRMLTCHTNECNSNNFNSKSEIVRFPYVYIVFCIFDAQREVGKSPLEAPQNNSETSYPPTHHTLRTNASCLLSIPPRNLPTLQLFRTLSLSCLSSTAAAAPRRLQRWVRRGMGGTGSPSHREPEGVALDAVFSALFCPC